MIDVGDAVQLEVGILVDKVSLFTAKRHCRRHGSSSMKGFAGTGENALPDQFDSATRDAFGVPSHVVPLGEDACLDDRLAGAPGPDLDGVAILKQRLDEGGNLLDLVAQLNRGKRRTKLF